MQFTLEIHQKKYKSPNKHQIQENTLYMKDKTHLNIVKCEQRKKSNVYPG